jgi:uncharacterized protein YkwD
MRILSQLKRRIRRILFPGSRTKSTYKQGAKKALRKVKVNSVNRIILSMVNKERRKRHITPVTFDRALHVHAINWSKRMAHQRRLSHSGTILENACMVPSHGSPITISKNMFHCWKGSPPHWAWMMKPTIHRAAFAYTKNGKYAYGAYAFK